MAKAMLEVIHQPDLRESLVERGYEYVERNGWAHKKKEYLDLIDSLSTERFDDIHPAFSRGRAFRTNRIERQGADALAAGTESLAIRLDDKATADPLKENVTTL
jgi:hypothetical protein